MKRFAVIFFMFAVSGCVRADFDLPRYGYYAKEYQEAQGRKAKGGDSSDWSAFDPTDVSHVQQYLRFADARLVRLIGQAEDAKYLTEIPVLGASVFSATSLALGKPGDRAIYGAAVGASGGLLSSYLAPRDRGAHAALAATAVSCVARVFDDQMVQGSNGSGVPLIAANKTNAIAAPFALKFPKLQGEITGAGILAVATTNDIFARLRLNLIKIGQTPDFTGIVKDIQGKLESVKAKVEPLNGINPSDDELLQAKYLAEYPVRLAECSAKYP